MDDTIIMDAVIQKYFAGETSEQEEKYLLAWLEESEEHRKYFFELKSLWGARRVFEESTDLARFASFMRSTDHRIGKIAAGVAIRQAPQAGAVDAGGRCCRPARRMRRHGMAFPFPAPKNIPGLYENTGRCGDDRHARRRDARVAQRPYEADAARSFRPRRSATCSWPVRPSSR